MFQQKRLKVLMIGLDGVTWDVIRPLIKSASLPTFKFLMENGVYGILESVIPPVTGPSWVSLVTGRNPGKTGIFDFLNRKTSTSYTLTPVSSSYFKGKAVWDYLSRFGFKVGVVAFPLLNPPYKVDGFMVSGMFGSKRVITYPKELIKEIIGIMPDGKYEVIVDYHNPKYDDVELFLKDLGSFLNKQFNMVLYLLREKYWDFFFYVCSATDWFQHLMWKYFDRNYPLYDQKKFQKYSDVVINFFKRIDEFIETALKLAGENTIIVIVSDHGFGPQWGVFNLSRWLELKGYMKVKVKKAKKYYLKLLLNKLHLVPLISSFLKYFLRKIGKRGGPYNLLVRSIEYDKSLAYTLGHTIPFGAIYLDAQQKNNSALREKIIGELKNLGNEINEELNIRIYKPEEIYWGPLTSLAPDIIFTINNWSCVIEEDPNKDFIYINEPFSNRHTGSHRLDGIFLMYGPHIRKGVNIGKVKIYDITPTILQLFKLPIPKDLDGKILMEIYNS